MRDRQWRSARAPGQTAIPPLSLADAYPAGLQPDRPGGVDDLLKGDRRPSLRARAVHLGAQFDDRQLVPAVAADPGVAARAVADAVGAVQAEPEQAGRRVEPLAAGPVRVGDLEAAAWQPHGVGLLPL